MRTDRRLTVSLRMGGGGGVSGRGGGCLVGGVGHPPWEADQEADLPCEQTNASENITFPALLRNAGR